MPLPSCCYSPSGYHPRWLTRRKFLATVAAAGAATVLKPLDTWAADEIDPKVAKLVASTLGIDTHNHIDVPLTAADVPGPDIDLAGEMKKSGLSAICMTFAVDYQPLLKTGDGYERFLNGLKAMDVQLQRNGMKRSLNLADLRAAHEKGQPTVVQSVEGGHFLEGHIERLEEAYQRGLRHLGLLHDNDASVPLGDIYTKPSRFGGLTAFGAETIKACNRLGILVDLAHADIPTVEAALKLSTQPVIISHTGLDWQLGSNPQMAQMMRPRLIGKEEAKVVADAGGVIGLWTHLTDTPLQYAQNFRALVDVVGIDHVCIGTDTKLTKPYRAPGGPGFGPKGKPDGAPHPDGPKGPHGGPHGPRAGERTNEAWPGEKVGFYYAVVAALLETGFTPEEIGKIGGGNFCRVFGAATA